MHGTLNPTSPLPTVHGLMSPGLLVRDKSHTGPSEMSKTSLSRLGRPWFVPLGADNPPLEQNSSASGPHNFPEKGSSRPHQTLAQTFLTSLCPSSCFACSLPLSMVSTATVLVQSHWLSLLHPGWSLQTLSVRVQSHPWSCILSLV